MSRAVKKETKCTKIQVPVAEAITVLTDKVMPNAKHGSCFWHKMDRNLINSTEHKSTIAKAKDRSILCRAEIEVFFFWMWYFSKFYETIEEINMTMKMLIYYLSDDQSGHIAVHESSFRRELREFLTKSFFENKHSLFDAYFTGMTLGRTSSSHNASYISEAILPVDALSFGAWN